MKNCLFYVSNNQIYLDENKPGNLVSINIPLFWLQGKLYLYTKKNVYAELKPEELNYYFNQMNTWIHKLSDFLSDNNLDHFNLTLIKYQPSFIAITKKGPEEIQPMHQVSFIIKRKKRYSMTIKKIDNVEMNKKRYFKTEESLLKHLEKHYFKDVRELLTLYLL